ncbi:MAG: F0F1 ATP synthase subunit delta [Bacteroidales bacterium]|nr:F0F1 ATP synthase subunit delta [Bacteroidales bacterium]
MDNGKISVRYARALLNTAKAEQCAKEVYEGLQRLTRQYSQAIAAFNEALSNPLVSPEKKQALLVTAIGEPVHPCLLRFIAFLIEKRRENKILLIALDYQQLYRKENRILRADVTTATELDDQALEAIRDYVRQTFHREVEMQVKVDPSLIGGFILDIEHERLDDSLAGRLNKLKKELQL